jgi:hypothetical protein
MLCNGSPRRPLLRGLRHWPQTLRYVPAAAWATHVLLAFTGVLPPGAGLKTRDAIPASTLLLR